MTYTKKWADISHSILEDKCSTKTGSVRRKKRRMKSGGFAPNKEESTSRTNKRKTEDSDEELRRAKK
jgi:hypothetical protein